MPTETARPDPAPSDLVIAAVLVVDTILLAIIWNWAGIDPETDWHPYTAPLALLAPSLGTAALLAITHRALLAAAGSAGAVLLSTSFQAYRLWPKMTDDRGDSSAILESLAYVAVTILLATSDAPSSSSRALPSARRPGPEPATPPAGASGAIALPAERVVSAFARGQPRRIAL